MSHTKVGNKIQLLTDMEIWAGWMNWPGLGFGGTVGRKDNYTVGRGRRGAKRDAEKGVQKLELVITEEFGVICCAVLADRTGEVALVLCEIDV
jgi:hypothetical protein